MIVERDGKFIILSKTGKKLGEESSREAAEKRLRQIEYFKHQNKNKGNKSMSGSVAGLQSDLVIDGKHHFPINDEQQAQNAVLRVTRLFDSPDWFHGEARELKQMVLRAVALRYPKLRVSVRTSAQAAIILGSDVNKISSKNITNAEMNKTDIKNPNKNESKVPEIPTPSIQYLDSDKTKFYAEKITSSYNNFQSFAADLVENIQKKQDSLKVAMKVAQRLSKDGLTGEEFNSLIGFLQEDILRELLMNGVTASTRRNEALERLMSSTMNPMKGPQKPTDGGENDKKKKKRGYE